MLSNNSWNGATRSGRTTREDSCRGPFASGTPDASKHCSDRTPPRWWTRLAGAPRTGGGCSSLIFPVITAAARRITAALAIAIAIAIAITSKKPRHNHKTNPPVTLRPRNSTMRTSSPWSWGYGTISAGSTGRICANRKPNRDGRHCRRRPFPPPFGTRKNLRHKPRTARCATGTGMDMDMDMDMGTPDRRRSMRSFRRCRQPRLPRGRRRWRLRLRRLQLQVQVQVHLYRPPSCGRAWRRSNKKRV
mmetsp:Transcript_19058/g.44085  ORF Transcript_19058/g.44085 Transcript_19058/m.44085 type:complete len:247 (+) Transcript_19058:127-867(+)